LSVKTGYTITAGRSLVSCAERDGLRLVCVMLSDPDDWNDHKSFMIGLFQALNTKEFSRWELSVKYP